MLLTSFNILYAIKKKFEYHHTAFFCSFTRVVASRPAYQLEFESLMHNALELYKRQHSICITNKKNRDQIFMKLRTKLSLDAFLNLDIAKLDSYETTRHIFYLINFAKIQTELKFEDVLSLVKTEKEYLLIPLPTIPNLIDKEIREAIPFTLLNKDK